MQRSEHIRLFVETIWEWFSEHKRTLPWRDLRIPDDTQRASMVLISEVMLQQTQVPRVTVIFRRFLECFPSIHDLAQASNKEVLLAWRGMGYNSRALRLRDAAKAVVGRFGGSFPREMEELRSLPGLGHYTAAAIRNFAFNLPTPCLDTNIRRVLHRAFVGPENPDGTWKKTDAYLLRLAADVLEVALESSSERSTANWHAALMDYGALVCTKANPRWDLCPLTRRGLMKAAYKVRLRKNPRRILGEPGRYVGSRYVPNRIFRGKVVEELRDEPRGLPLEEIGKRVCIDWSPREHRRWLSAILAKLREDRMIEERRKRYVLAD